MWTYNFYEYNGFFSIKEYYLTNDIVSVEKNSWVRGQQIESSNQLWTFRGFREQVFSEMVSFFLIIIRNLFSCKSGNWELQGSYHHIVIIKYGIFD